MGLRYAVIVAVVTALTVLFVTNRRYVYPESLGKLPTLTAAHIVDPRYVGATFRLEGRVTSVRTSQQGIVFIDMHEPAEDIFIDVPVFSVARLPPGEAGARRDAARDWQLGDVFRPTAAPSAIGGAGGVGVMALTFGFRGRRRGASGRDVAGWPGDRG